MYKLESIVEDGGTLVIYAPAVSEVSPTHGRWIMEIGYHSRDYFLKQWDRFCGVPRSVLAHSTHVKGRGTFENGVEAARIDVRLATGIPEPVCGKINLGYQDPNSVRVDALSAGSNEDVMVVPNAGEILWRLSDTASGNPALPC